MNHKPTTVTHALRDGQLEHVVRVQGEPVQSHSSLKAAMCALALAMALSGCEFCREHPGACATIAAGAAGCVVLSVHGNREAARTHDTGLSPVNCNGGACK